VGNDELLLSRRLNLRAMALIALADLKRGGIEGAAVLVT